MSTAAPGTQLNNQAGTSKPPAPPRGAAVSTKATMLLLVVPSLILVILINAYPLVYAVGQSLHNGTLISTGDFVGLQNYKNELTSPDFWAAARFTLIFTIVGVFGSW